MDVALALQISVFAFGFLKVKKKKIDHYMVF